MSDLFGGAALDTWRYCRMAAQAKAQAQQLSAEADRNVVGEGLSYCILPPGIFWQKTGGKTHRVVIRREPEYVIDRLGLGNAL